VVGGSFKLCVRVPPIHVIAGSRVGIRLELSHAFKPACSTSHVCRNTCCTAWKFRAAAPTLWPSCCTWNPLSDADTQRLSLCVRLPTLGDQECSHHAMNPWRTLHLTPSGSSSKLITEESKNSPSQGRRRTTSTSSRQQPLHSPCTAGSLAALPSRHATIDQ
jgi:hypothetical protein